MRTLTQLVNKIRRINALTLDKDKQIRAIILNEQTLDKLINNNIYLITGVYIINKNLPNNLYQLVASKDLPSQFFRPTDLVICKKIKTFNQLENWIHKIETQEKSFISIIGSSKTINLIKPKRIKLLTFTIHLSDRIPENILYGLPIESAKQFINNNITEYIPNIYTSTINDNNSIYYWSRYNTNDTK